MADPAARPRRRHHARGGATERGNGPQERSAFTKGHARERASADAANWRHTPPNSSPSADQATNSSRAQDALPVQGECMEMCPVEELHDRQRTNEISRFERSSDGTSWAVKKYRRPAAGRIEINPRELRPPAVLDHTLRHLFTNVLPWHGCGFDWKVGTATITTARATEFLALYHFISDRVRSVRKDFVIQRVATASRITALVQIARFHLLASHCAVRLLPHGDKTLDWSEPLNDQQLASALVEAHALFHLVEDADVMLYDEVIVYDILLNVRDPHAVSVRLLKLPMARLLSPLVGRVLRLFTAFHTRDFHVFVRSFRLLPVLQQCLVARHLPTLWLTALQVMNKAYGKMDRFSMDTIAQWIDLPSPSAARTLCVSLGIHVEDEGGEDETASAPPPPTTTADSWEESDIPMPAPAPTTRRSFVRFKVTAMNDEVPSEVASRLVVEKAAAIFSHGILRSCSASELVLEGGPAGKASE